MGHAYIAFIDPSDLHIWSLYSETIDSCLSGTPPEATSLGISSLQLTSDSGSEIDLAWSTAALLEPSDSETVEGFTAENLTSDQIQNEYTFSLTETEDGVAPSFSAKSLFQFPKQPDILEPTFNGSVQVDMNNLRIRWTTNSSGDAILIKAIVVDDDDSVIDTVTCAATDDGEFQVDGAQWTNWKAEKNIILQVGRFVEGSTEMPLSNAQFRVGGIYWTVTKGKTR